MKIFVSTSLAVIFFFGSLFPQTDVEEFFKVPQLLLHYQDHKAETPENFSFLDYIIMHYSISSAHAQTPHPEANLPMYHYHLCTGLAFIISEYLFHLESQFSFTAFAKFIYKQNYAYLFSYSLLQPPRYF